MASNSKSVTLSVRPRGKPAKKLPEEVTLTSNGSTFDLYHEIARTAGTSVHRLRITKGSDGSVVPNAKSLSVHSTGLREQSTVYVKDLGPQLGWRTVFLVEYLGPILIHPILYAVLPSSSGPSQLQTLTFALIIIHFVKRELETLFIHRFSAATMPLLNIFKNSAHYWLLAGANIAFWTYRPFAPAAGPSNPYITYPAILLYVIGEVGNLYTHVVLRNLRSRGGKERGIPQGWGFGLVTCPNYMFETVAWVGVGLVAWSWSGVVFLVAALVPMGRWARKKESRYRQEFGEVYRAKRNWAQVRGAAENLNARRQHELTRLERKQKLAVETQDGITGILSETQQLLANFQNQKKRAE
ncbi:3-oxo-5a-steroid 4- dehydrogenase [Sticta canariensis]|nr:3-oxo-5a-steroid 4- dehydrogenase [Sticta canariensis]